MSKRSLFPSTDALRHWLRLIWITSWRMNLSTAAHKLSTSWTLVSSTSLNACVQHPWNVWFHLLVSVVLASLRWLHEAHLVVHGQPCCLARPSAGIQIITAMVAAWRLGCRCVKRILWKPWSGWVFRGSWPANPHDCGCHPLINRFTVATETIADASIFMLLPRCLDAHTNLMRFSN